MNSRRSEVMAFAALILAAFALFAVLSRGPVSSAVAGPNLQETTGVEPQSIGDSTFNYQGVLRLPDGSLANGTFDMSLAIYDVVAGGVPLHQEQFNGVAVRDGIFNVIMGGDGANPIGKAVFAQAPRYLGITVLPDTEMLPRQRIHPVPWALQSERATGATFLEAPDGSPQAVTVDNEGRVGVGRTNPAADLDVAGTVRIRNSGDEAVLLQFDTERSWQLRQEGTDGATALKFTSVGGGGNKNFLIDTAGRVGIGINSPSQTLDVAGSALIRGDLDWNGDLKGFGISGEYRRESNNGSDQTPLRMTTTSNSICYLVKVSFRNIDDESETDTCEIYSSGGYWYLRALSNGDANTFCEARCLWW